MSHSISERVVPWRNLTYVGDPSLRLSTQVSADHRPATLAKRHRPLWHTASDIDAHLLHRTHVRAAYPSLTHFTCVGVKIPFLSFQLEIIYKLSTTKHACKSRGMGHTIRVRWGSPYWSILAKARR